MKNEWTKEENTALVELYFWMLQITQEACGAKFKAPAIRIAQGKESAKDKMNWGGDDGGFERKLPNRSRGSIEAKLMNCSAAHRDLLPAGPDVDYETMHEYGYRYRTNYQIALKDAVRDHINRSK